MNLLGNWYFFTSNLAVQHNTKQIYQFEQIVPEISAFKKQNEQTFEPYNISINIHMYTVLDCVIQTDFM